MGDLYRHQEFRERIVAFYPNNSIIFLPQSIHYRDESNVARSQGILNAHSNLTILVRDEYSFQFACNSFPKAKTLKCPDMATFLYPMKCKQTTKKYETVHLMRTDIEQSSDLIGQTVSGRDWVGDWREALGYYYYLVKLFQLINMALVRVVPQRLKLRLWEKISRLLVARAVQIFCSSSRISTSRLHGHLLALLLDKEVSVLDNCYGKNLRYVDLWHNKSTMIQK